MNAEQYCSDSANRFREKVFKREQRVGIHYTDYELELASLREAPFGKAVDKQWIKSEFMLNCFRFQWPDFLNIESNGYENLWLKRIVRAFNRWAVLDLLGCAGSGKTQVVSACAYTAWKCSPWNTSVFLSTTSMEAGGVRTWGYVKDLHEKDKFRVGVRLEYRSMIVLQEDPKNKERDYRDAISAVAIKKGAEGRDAIGAISGRHNTNVIWCCQPLSSKVLTPRGWVEMGSIYKGDKVINSRGQAQKVRFSAPPHREKIYRLTFSDKSQTKCTLNHVWTLLNMRGNPVTKPLAYFMQHGIKRKGCGGSFKKKWSLPDNPVVEYEPSKVPISPYLLGCLLGDGSILKSAAFYNQDPEIVEHFRREIPNGHSLTNVRFGQYHIRGQNKKNLVIQWLRDLGLFGCGAADKFIPEIYLRSSVTDRIHMLQGLLDTDGTALKSTIRYTSISRRLRRGVIEIVRSLGGYARECKEKDVVIRLDAFSPFRSSRKLTRLTGTRFNQRRKALMSVEECGEEEVRCISVSSEDGLYITDDFILTHNCDEFPHMDIGVLEGRLNTLANPHGQFIGIGNRPKEGDPLYIDAEPKGDKFPFGWKSVTPDNPAAQWWTTQAGACYYFDGEKSPNLQAPEDARVPFPYLMNRKMIATIEKASGGKDSIGYWGQVKGFPISGEIQDTVLNGALIKARGADQPAVWGIETPVCIAGLDLGFREDGDPCVADFGRIGKDIEGRTILEHERDAVQIRTKPSDMRPFEEQIAEGFINEAKKRDCHEVELDISADGGIIAQALAEKARAMGYSLKIVLCSFMGKPGHPEHDVFYEVGDERKEAGELFDRKVSELWYSYRFSVQNGVIRGLNHESKAVKQLCERKVHQDDKKRYIVETKKMMKKRIKRSPDEGDSRAVLHSLALKHGLTGAGRVAARSSKPKPPTRPDEPKSRYGWKQPQRKMYAGR